MKKRIRVLLCCLICLLAPIRAPGEALPVYDYGWKGTSCVKSFSSDTLCYTIEKGCIGENAHCYFTKIWMKNPGNQIRKATADWEESLANPEEMAQTLPEALLTINGSGFVSPNFPEIPTAYPGTSEDYYYTPLGSLTVTDGVIFRNLEGVPFYGLTLQQDGLHLHVGEDNEAVLAGNPAQTWSFYEGCPLILDGESLLDTEWEFAKRRAIRNIIAKINANNYLIITATSTKGLKLTDAVPFIMETFAPEWAYNLDGGSSTALLARSGKQRKLQIIYGSHVSVVDIMAFTE